MIKKSNYKNKAELSYNPDDVNIRVQHFRVFKIIEMLDKDAIDIFDKDFEEVDRWNKKREHLSNLFGDEGEGDDIEIDIDDTDDVQRNSGLWNTVQKSRFIESLMIKIPIPAFYFDGSQKPWRVVDGLQRLHTIRSFVSNDFKLSGLEYLGNECGGRLYNDTNFPLPGYLKKRILDAEIIAYVINPGTPNNVKYNIFKRINTGGLQLNGQEIRNAFFHGPPADFTKKLAVEENFIKATNSKVTPRRMMDREYANRFIAFQLFDYNDYNGKMDFFLSEAMNELYDRSEQEIDDLAFLFNRSMKRTYELFGGFGFYRPKLNNEWGRQPNKALFDTLSWNLSELNDSQFSRLKNQSAIFERKYRKFMNEDEIIFKSINDTTGSKSAVINRFNKLNSFIKDFKQ